MACHIQNTPAAGCCAERGCLKLEHYECPVGLIELYHWSICKFKKVAICKQAAKVLQALPWLQPSASKQMQSTAATVSPITSASSQTAHHEQDIRLTPYVLLPPTSLCDPPTWPPSNTP